MWPEQKGPEAEIGQDGTCPAARIQYRPEAFFKTIGFALAARKASRSGDSPAISREFEKSVNWLLTGKAHVEPKKRVAKDPAAVE
jgi:hypothetical protein